MKPIPAIIEPAQIDLDLIGKQLDVALSSRADAERTTERHEKAAAVSRETARMRRLEIGQLLTQARGAWPARGPAPKGVEGSWAGFLAAHKLDDATASRYMAEYKDPEGFAQKTRLSETPDIEAGNEDDDQTGAKAPPPDTGQRPPFRELTADEIIEQRAELNRAAARLPAKDRKRIAAAEKSINAHGGSGEVERGTWCTGKEWAIAAGPWDHDPFSNPRSHVLSVTRCMREDGGDGFGGGEPGAHPGHYLLGERHGSRSGVATELTRVWLQPPYDIVLDAIAHYGHTQFCALLRLSPDVEWFRRLWPLVATIAVPLVRLPFEPPPGIEDPKSSIPQPHALYYACADDITREIRDRCIVLPVDHGRCDPAILRSALRLVE